MKAVLKTLEDFQVSSVFMQAENQLCISFVGITDYNELRAKLTVQAMTEVKVYSNETDFVAYEDFTKLIDPSQIFKTVDGTYDIVTVFEKEDEIRAKLNELNERQTLVEGALNEIILE
jgi:hypothetical protein